VISIAEQVAELINRLDRSGWFMGDFAEIGSEGGLVWWVVGVNGPQTIKVEGESQLAAWKLAESKARDLGLLAE
jgi:hypothetical protein